MANTTNFNWETPDDTDLVKDGAAAIRTLGNSIDTSFVDLKGGTTGQILSKASNTDLDYTWINNDQGDITAVTATAPLTGGGTSGAVTVGIQDATTTQKGAVQLENSTSSTSTTTAAVPASVKSAYDLANAAIPKNTVTTAGDIIYGTGSSTVTRLGVGTAGQVLAVNSGATAVEWITPSAGGGLTVIGTTTLSGSSTTISSIPSTYKHLMILIERAYAAQSNYPIAFRFNSDTGSNYSNKSLYGDSDANAYAYYRNDSNNSTSMEIISRTLNTVNAGKNLNVVLNIYNYTSTSPRFLQGSAYSMNDGNTVFTTQTTGTYKGSSAISSVSVFPQVGGSTWSGGTFTVYGVS